MKRLQKKVELARAICQLIEDHLDEALTLVDLGDHFELSPTHLQRSFESVLGITPKQYADACRLRRLKVGLREDKTVTQALFEAGYGSVRQLYERAGSLLGMTPATYRKGGEGMSMGYVFADCALGRALMAATQRGVSAVYFGDDEDKLIDALKEEYPKADVQPDGSHLQSWLAELLEHLDGKRPQIDLPLDVQATAFQWRVWQELRKIPYGGTKTYSEIAEALEQPNASRAVGSACGKNPVSVIVPCHRVVRGDGSLGGYRWGLSRKQGLLDLERQRSKEPR